MNTFRLSLLTSVAFVSMTGLACSKKPSAPSVPLSPSLPGKVPGAEQPPSKPTQPAISEKDRALAEAKKKVDADISRLVPKDLPEPVPTTPLGKDVTYEDFPAEYVAAAKKRGYPALDLAIERWTFGQGYSLTDKEPRPKTTYPEMTVPTFGTSIDGASFEKNHIPVSPVPCALITRSDIKQNLSSELFLQKNVVSLEIDFIGSTNFESVETLAKLPNLRMLKLKRIKNDELTRALGLFKGVSSLSINGNFEKSHAEFISQNMDLQELAIQVEGALSDESVAEICKLKSLKTLSLRVIHGNGPTNVSAYLIARLSRLEELDLAGIASFNVDGFAALTRLTHLRKLAIAGFDSYFAMHDKYKIYRTPLRIEALEPLTNIQTFIVSNSHTFNSGDFAKFNNFPNLEVLGLGYSPKFDDGNLAELAGIKSLKLLALSKPENLSKGALDKFKATLPSCVIRFWGS